MVSNTEELLEKILRKMEECMEAERHVDEKLTNGQCGEAALNHLSDRNAELNHLLRLATDNLAALDARLEAWQ